MAIRQIDTISMDHGSHLPGLVFVTIHSTEGLVGHGETYYVPSAVEAYVHDFAADFLLGANESLIESLWLQQYDLTARFGGGGAEMRSISAIDLALWDLAGKKAQMPLHQLLGGAVRKRIPVYNTCAGPTYGKSRTPAHGDHGEAVGEFEDLRGFLERPAELAEELLEDGFRAMKIWPFDQVAQQHGGQRIASNDLASGMWPVEQIRSQVGSEIDIMIEGHGYWSLPAAIQIARALEPLAPAWIEDLTLADQPAALRRLREASTIPLSVSEYLMTRWGYLPMLLAEAADLMMIDPTWAGGITESRKISSMADVFRLPVTMHDCTGPFTLLAGIHIAATSPNALYQELVRSFIRRVYPDWVDWMPVVVNGTVGLPTGHGLGANLHEDLVYRPGYRIRSSTHEE